MTGRVVYFYSIAVLLLGYIGVDKFVSKIMVNSNDCLRSFQCSKLWQWCNYGEDENGDTNLTLQANDEF